MENKFIETTRNGTGNEAAVLENYIYFNELDELIRGSAKAFKLRQETVLYKRHDFSIYLSSFYLFLKLKTF